MSKQFHVDIIALDKKIYEGDISSLIVPGEVGYLGILANHAPLVTTLIKGKISFREPSGKESVLHSVGKGFLEVYQNNVTILLDKVELPPAA